MQHRVILACALHILAMVYIFHVVLQSCCSHSQFAHAATILSSQIQNCTKDDWDIIECKKKLSVMLAVGDEESVSVDSAVDETALTRGTVAPTVRFSAIQLSTKRSPVRYRYPLIYTHNYNAKPYEVNVRGAEESGCNADFSSVKATCGVAHDDDGVPIKYSQGFCCACTQCIKNNSCDLDSRAKSTCSMLGTFPTASCLGLDSVWYSGYEIGRYSTWYTLNLTLVLDRTGNEEVPPGEPIKRIVLHLQADKFGDTSSVFPASGHLLDNMTSLGKAKDLASHMLFVPAMPLESALIRAGMKEWMLINKTHVSLDGRECNKIGTYYEAFASQADACFRSIGSCLNWQLKDYRQADLERIAKGESGLYMLPALGSFDQRQYSIGPLSVQSPYLTYVTDAPQLSTVRVMVSADEMQLKEVVEPGHILNASLDKEEQQVKNRSGHITVYVQNTGTLAARFTVTIDTCTGGGQPIPERVLSIEPSAVHEAIFDVIEQGVFLSSEASCTVTLHNALLKVVDTRVVWWKEQDEDVSGRSQDTPPGGSAEATSGDTAATCIHCSFLDVKCTFGHLCVMNMVLQHAMLLLIAGLIVVVYRFRRRIFSLSCDGHKRPPKEEHSADRVMGPIPTLLSGTAVRDGGSPFEQPPPEYDASLEDGARPDTVPTNTYHSALSSKRSSVSSPQSAYSLPAFINDVYSLSTHRKMNKIDVAHVDGDPHSIHDSLGMTYPGGVDTSPHLFAPYG